MAIGVGLVAALVILGVPRVGLIGTAVGAAGADVPIVFGTNTGTDTGSKGIGVVNADGSGRRIVLPPPTNQDSYIQPDLSPDGRRIVFSACDDRNFRYPHAYCLLATVNVDGSDFRMLQHGNQSGHWSPDGNQIAAIRFEANPHEPHLSVISADGSKFRDIVNTWVEDVDWSPDGKTLVFSSTEPDGDRPPFRKSKDQDPVRLLYTVPAGGSSKPRLLGTGIPGSVPSWSPDGTQIAFRRTGDRMYAAVAVVNADGSGLRDVVQSDSTSFGRPGWSPDSTRIAVATYLNTADGKTRTPTSVYDLVTGSVTPVLPTGGGSLSWANASGPSPCTSGYWLVAGDGGVFSFGTAGFFGSAKTARPRRPVVGMAASPSGRGYWLVASDGGVFSFGDARFAGSARKLSLNKPIVGLAATPSGRGYWLVASDGGVFSFGDAGFFGSTGGLSLNKPVVGMAASPSGRGYWLVASDGGVFSFGDAGFHGSTGALTLNKPVVSIAASSSGGGYWLVAADGGIFTFGDAAQIGSAASPGLPSAIVGSSATAGALLLAGADGSVVPFGQARFCGSMYRQRLRSPTVGVALVP